MKLRNIAIAVALVVVGATLALAQSGTYTQTVTYVGERAGTLEFYHVPFNPGPTTYYLACAYGELYVGCVFDPTILGTAHNGSISEVVTQFPATNQPDGPYSFKFTTTDGHSGSVSGTGKWASYRNGVHPVLDANGVLTVN